MPTARNIELVISDVDGTLVTQDKTLTERTRRAVHALGAAGIRFAITSSRPPRGMASLVAALDIQTPIAGFNGGVFARPDQKILKSSAIDPATGRRAVEIIAGCGLDLWVFTENEWLAQDPGGAHVAHETMTVGFPPSIVSGFGDALDRAFKIVGVSNDHDRVGQTEGRVQKALTGAASISRSQPYYLDVTSVAANKGSVVDYLSRHLDIGRARIMAIGDGPNDVQMFDRAGFSVAMGNAAPQAKAAATEITDSNEQDGFAKAVERFLLENAVIRNQSGRDGVRWP